MPIPQAYMPTHFHKCFTGTTQWRSAPAAEAPGLPGQESGGKAASRGRIGASSGALESEIARLGRGREAVSHAQDGRSRPALDLILPQVSPTDVSHQMSALGAAGERTGPPTDGETGLVIVR